MLKALELPKLKKIKFEGDWDEFEAKYCFQRQSWQKYMKQALVLV